MQSANETKYPLHPAQEGIYCEIMQSNEEALHNLACINIYPLSIFIDFKMLQDAWKLVTKYCDCLRLLPSRELINSRPIQTLLPFELVKFNFIYIDKSHVSDMILLDDEIEISSDAYQWLLNDIDRGLQISKNETSQLALIQTSDSFIVCTKIHHFSIDGIALRQLNDIFNRVYNDIRQNNSTDWLFTLPSFIPEITKGQEYLSSKRYIKDQSYWTSQLQQSPTFKLKRNYKTSLSDSITVPIPKTLCSDIETFCSQQSISPLVMLLGVCSFYFSSVYKLNYLPISTVVHGRRNKPSECALGMYSNIIPILCDHAPEDSPIQQLMSNNKSLRSTLRHSLFPVNHITRLNGGVRVSDIIINYESFVQYGEQQFDGCKTYRLSPLINTNPLMIRWIHYYTNSMPKLHFTFNQGYFHSKEIQLLADRIMYLLKAFITSPHLPLSSFELLPNTEKKILIAMGNGTPLTISNNESVNTLLDSHIISSNHDIAIIHLNQEYTYSWLYKKIHQLTHLILNHWKIHPIIDHKALIYFDRSPELITQVSEFKIDKFKSI